MYLSSLWEFLSRRNHHNIQRHVHSLAKQFHISCAIQFNFINTFDIGKWSLLNLCIYPLKSPSQCQSNNSNGDNFKRSLTRSSKVEILIYFTAVLCRFFFFKPARLKHKEKKVAHLFKGEKGSNVLNYTPDLNIVLFSLEAGGGGVEGYALNFASFYVVTNTKVQFLPLVAPL